MPEVCAVCGTHPAFLEVDCRQPDLAGVVAVMQDRQAGETRVRAYLDWAARHGLISVLDQVVWGLWVLGRNRG